MRRTRTAILLAGTLLVSARAIAQSDPQIAAAVVGADNFPAASVAFDGGVRGWPDLVYANVPGFQPLKLDVYAQDRRPGGEARPLILYIHGGGWTGGHSRASGAFADFPAALASLAARGYVVVSLNYRLSAEAKFPAGVQDVKAALRYLRANADRFGIDRGKAVVWGASAGGHLAALVATTCGLAALEPAAAGRTGIEAQAATGRVAQSDCVQGLIGWYGQYDFAPLAGKAGVPVPTQSPASYFLGCREGPCAETVALASPLAQVDRSDPPALLIHGTEDSTIPIAQTRAFEAALEKAGVKVESLYIPAVGHSWIGKTPAATRDATLQAWRSTLTWIDALFGR